MLTGRRVVVTGGTGSLGKCLVRRLLAGELGKPAKVTVFSRDEAKQHAMRLESHRWPVVTDEVIYGSRSEELQFVVGDVRDYPAVAAVLKGADYVIHAAAMKQVPTCEYNVVEAIQTNIYGAVNIVRAIHECQLPVHAVVGISTDKAVKPVNVYGMTKAIQERLFLTANLESTTRFASVRYGNVLGSRGSVIPLFHDQIRRGGPVTVTSAQMTRFFFTIDQAVDTVFALLGDQDTYGRTYVPRLPAVRVMDLAKAMIGERPIKIVVTGIRPGEKIHEVLISEEERHRVELRDRYYVIHPILPEIQGNSPMPSGLSREYTSAADLIDQSTLRELLSGLDLLVEGVMP